jgi:threonine synthase
MTIKYRSTRGKQNGLSFEEVVLGGLASDKGLFVPETIPTLTLDEIEKVVQHNFSSFNFNNFCVDVRCDR